MTSVQSVARMSCTSWFVFWRKKLKDAVFIKESSIVMILYDSKTAVAVGALFQCFLLFLVLPASACTN